MYDLIIIGGGPAAISAGIYAARKKIKTILITESWGGQMALASSVKNYPGIESISGMDLVTKFTNHLKKNDIEIKEGVKVKEIRNNDSIIEVKTNSNSYESKAIIITTGRIPKKLGLPREEEFIGKGISYCAVCDAPLYKNKTVAVIGGANAGLGTALSLTAYASKIYVLEFLPKLNADEFLQEKIKKSAQITVLTNVEIKEFKGEQFIDGLIYQERDSRQSKEISVEGIFVSIGSTSNSFLVKNMVKLNKQGEIKIDSENRTSQPNIFAAGDVTNISHKQIVIAAGEGAKAALNVYEYLQ
ncbi:MAG: FAD-dependent oxidoreductase [Parcubacteria group bacterium]|nr:FAD-dependent oxidoreductase [Parcubacteria group bacterium]